MKYLQLNQSPKGRKGLKNDDFDLQKILESVPQNSGVSFKIFQFLNLTRTITDFWRTRIFYSSIYILFFSLILFQSIMPTPKRVQMFQYLYGLPIEMTAYGHRISYGTMGTVLAAIMAAFASKILLQDCLLYTSPSPRD